MHDVYFFVADSMAMSLVGRRGHQRLYGSSRCTGRTGEDLRGGMERQGLADVVVDNLRGQVYYLLTCRGHKA